MFIKTAVFTLIIYSILENVCARTLNIELHRQKTPREQQLNAPDLSEYGINFDWTYKNHTNRTTDSINLLKYLDNEFYGKIVIGHPGQTLNVAFDTAWSYSWVISSQCNSIKTLGCYFHNKYNHDKSSEYKKDGRPFVVNEGTYNLTGFFSYDNISIAHSNVTNQSFVEMTYLPKNYMFNKADGVLGLGLKTGPYNPFFYTLLDQNKIKEPIFSIYFNRDTQSIHGGNIMLGYVEKRHIWHVKEKGVVIYENFTYLSIDPDLSYWQFNIDKIRVSLTQNSLNLTLCTKGCKGIVDSSSNIILGPDNEVKQIHEAIHARELFFGRYSVPCDTVNKLPIIDIVLSGKNFTLKGEDYITKITFKEITLCLSSFVSAQTPDEIGRWILGGSFLGKFYTVYNIKERNIGFVRSASTPQ